MGIRHDCTNSSPSNRPMAVCVFPISIASSMPTPGVGIKGRAPLYTPPTAPRLRSFTVIGLRGLNMKELCSTRFSLPFTELPRNILSCAYEAPRHCGVEQSGSSPGS